MRRLINKTAVVTGASSGIGAAIARRLAAEGAAVVINYRQSADKAQALVTEIEASGGQALAVAADMAAPAAVEKLVTTARNWLGRVDIWVNNAGADILTGAGARLDDYAKLQQLLAVDLQGTMYGSWAVAPVMQAQADGGVIVNISWDLIDQGMPGRNPEMFAAVKGGINAFTKCLAQSLAPNVRVNDVAPGWIATAFAQEAMTPEYYQGVIEQTPLRRFGTPDDIAAAVAYLASDDAGFITGQTLKVNGGLSA
ncbi:MAG: SDR family oxidoreductase [Gammaproteobacteria bacterium]